MRSGQLHWFCTEAVCGTNYTCSVYKTASSFFTCPAHAFLPDTNLSQPPHRTVSSHLVALRSAVCTCAQVRVILLTFYWWSDVHLIRLLSRVSLRAAHSTSVIPKLPCSPKTHTKTQSVQIKSSIPTQTCRHITTRTHKHTPSAVQPCVWTCTHRRCSLVHAQWARGRFLKP